MTCKLITLLVIYPAQLLMGNIPVFNCFFEMYERPFIFPDHPYIQSTALLSDISITIPCMCTDNFVFTVIHIRDCTTKIELLK